MVKVVPIPTLSYCNPCRFYNTFVTVIGGGLDKEVECLGDMGTLSLRGGYFVIEGHEDEYRGPLKVR